MLLVRGETNIHFCVRGSAASRRRRSQDIIPRLRVFQHNEAFICLLRCKNRCVPWSHGGGGLGGRSPRVMMAHTSGT